MDFTFTPQEEAFRKEIREFIKKELPRKYERVVVHGGESEEEWEFTKQFTRKIGEKGWIATLWPKKYGGLEGTEMQYLIFNEEMAYARAPRMDQGGSGIVGPTILVHGTEEQKNKFLPPIAHGEVMWIQCFSEPNFGSDSGGIQTSAVLDGDHYVINGQKIWISFGLHGDFCYMTTRTDTTVSKHKGISFFLLDMKTPGIEVRPIVNMVGAPGFCEVYFDNVRVPKENMLGPKNGGWLIMMTILGFERGTLAAIGGSARRALDDLVDFVKNTSYGGKPLAKDPIVRQRVADMAIEVYASRLLAYRVIWMITKGMLPHYQASIAKVFGDEVYFKLAKVATEIMGLYGTLAWHAPRAPMDGYMTGNYLNNLGCLFAGGTPEIQRNIIATVGLGLPRG